MKKILPFICFFVFISCNSKNAGQQHDNVPEALQDKEEKSNITRYSKGRGDMIDELYEEKLEKMPALLAIDKLYKELKENKLDLPGDVNSFDQKNDQYYESANLRLRRIHDSLLRKEIETALTNSSDRFKVKTARLTALNDALSRAEVSADDRYEGVKLLITLRMIELYQNNLPSSKPIESMIGSFNELNKRLDSVINKHK